MAQKKQTESEIKETLDNEQLSDILLVVDRKNKKVEAVKSIEQNGDVKTVPALKKNAKEFMLIGHNSDPLDIAVTAIKNFYRQNRDPTEITLLKVPLKTFLKTFRAVKNTAQLFKGLLEDSLSGLVAEFADKHRLDDSQSAQQNNINNNKEETMAKRSKKSEENQQPVQQPVQAPVQQGQKTATESKLRFTEALIDWNSLKDFGISKDFLKDKGLLDGMLKGYKTSQLVPISLNINDAIAIRTDARLSFQQSKTGPVTLAVHGVRREPQLDKPYFGHIFSEEDKKNLLETGNMGRTVELKNRAGEIHPYLISIDKLTNELPAVRADLVFIPDEVSGIKLNDDDKAALREGKKIFVEGMISKGGKEFSAHLQVNADKRGVEYIFPDRSNQKIQILGGVELSSKQQKDLNEGRAIFVEDMKRKDGELFSSFVKKDPVTNSFSYSRYNPDSPEHAREIYIPKEIGGVKLTGDERDLLRKGQPIFLDGMINRKGEEFSSYIKANTETGKLSYARTPDGFDYREQFKIPAEVFGVTLNATQRAKLQDGKSIHVEGMKGFDGKEFSSFIKVNPNQAKLDYTPYDPDAPKNTQRNTAETTQGQSEEKKRTRGQRM